MFWLPLLFLLAEVPLQQPLEGLADEPLQRSTHIQTFKDQGGLNTVTAAKTFAATVRG